MAVTDLPEGFAVDPELQRARSMRMVLIAMAAGALLALVLLAILALHYERPVLWLAAVAYVLVIVPADWAAWRVIRPPLLKADSASVIYASGFKTTRLPRAELQTIFQGQTFVSGRSGGWFRAYLFTRRGGKVAFAALEVWFSPADIAEFARRLNLPVRGDFSERVGDTVGMTAVAVSDRSY